VLANAVALYSSPARRALDTAGPICNTLGLKQRIMLDLREIDFGWADGLTYKEVETEFPDFYDRLMKDTYEARFPDGESREDLRVRVRATLDEIASAQDGVAENRHPVVVVTHAGVIRVSSEFTGLDDANPDYASVTELSWPVGSSPP
jgi:broad specificity phosphatase PhoE